MNYLLVTAVLLFASTPAFSQHRYRPQTSIVFPFGGSFAQVVDGGGWKTIFVLVNLDTHTATYKLNFYADSGNALALDTTAGNSSSLTGTIPVGGSVTFETRNVKADLSQGWADMISTDALGGAAIFRQSVAGRPDFEASLPLDTDLDNRVVLPFDQIGATTGVALVNPLSASNLTVVLIFRDESGIQFLLDSFQMSPRTHLAFTLSQRYPQTAGKRGTVEITTAGLYMNVIGLRFGQESFTSIEPLVNALWF